MAKNAFDRSVSDYLLEALALAEKDPAKKAFIDRSLSGLKKLQNTEFAPIYSAIFLEKPYALSLKNALECYHNVLLKLLKYFVDVQEVRTYFGFSDGLETLLLKTGHILGAEVCRYDGYVCSGSGEYKILEHNADSPAGTVFTSKINSIHKNLVETIAPGIRLNDWKINDEYCFVNHLLAKKPSPNKADGVILILVPKGQPSNENKLLHDLINSTGSKCVISDPSQITIQEGKTLCQGQPVSLIWNKVNVATWRSDYGGSLELLSILFQSIMETNTIHVNGMMCRYVAENKLSLAIFQEEQFNHLLSEEENILLRKLLPWARKVESNKEVVYKGRNHNLLGLITENKDDFVLKEHYDIRGDGVTLGKSVGQEGWIKAVSNAIERGMVVQEYVAPTKMNIMRANGSKVLEYMNTSLDAFIFDGELVGFGSKCSLNDKVNIFQGGGKASILLGDIE